MGNCAAEQRFSWTDLLSRREALGLNVEQLTDILGVDRKMLTERETGARTVGERVIAELESMEQFVTAVTSAMLADSPSDVETGVLELMEDQAEFERTFPAAVSLREKRPYPVTLHYVAAGRAAADLGRRGQTVRIQRGDKNADLMARRLAAGMGKTATAAVLGIDKKHYYSRWEGGKIPAAGVVAEMQAIDDFITAVAAKLEVRRNSAGIILLGMLDDQHEFEKQFPRARSVRDGNPYPVVVHRVAVGRRTRELNAAGELVRITMAG